MWNLNAFSSDNKLNPNLAAYVRERMRSTQGWTNSNNRDMLAVGGKGGLYINFLLLQGETQIAIILTGSLDK